jgi:hypothetical protein
VAVRQEIAPREARASMSDRRRTRARPISDKVSPAMECAMARYR